MLNPRLQMQPATDSPLGRIRRGEPSPPPPPKAEKPPKVKEPKAADSPKKERKPKKPRERKGPVTFPVMPTPCPADVTEAARWHGERLAIVVSRIPPDELAGPHGAPGTKPPSAATVQAAAALAKACGFEETREFRRARRCFWGCMEIVCWMFKHEKDSLLRGAALQLVAETFREKVTQ